MPEDVTLPRNTRSTKVRLNEDVWELAVALVRQFNAGNPIAKASLQSVTNAAVRDFARQHLRQEADDDGNAAA